MRLAPLSREPITLPILTEAPLCFAPALRPRPHGFHLLIATPGCWRHSVLY